MSKKILMFLPAVMLLCSCAAVPVTKDRPELTVPHAAIPPVIDGTVSDPEWTKAGVIKGLKPCLGGKYQDKIDMVPTEIRVLWTEDFLYVAFICIDDDIVATMTEHDDLLYKEDVSEVFLDPYGDGRQYFELQVSPNNVVLDKMFVLSAEPEYTDKLRFKPTFKDNWGFLEWNFSDLQTATAPLLKDGKKIGWTTEMAIPAKLLAKRYGKEKLFPTTMRANFMRYDWQPDKNGKRKMIHMNWSPVQHGCPHISPAAMGYLKLEE